MEVENRSKEISAPQDDSAVQRELRRMEAYVTSRKVQEIAMIDERRAAIVNWLAHSKLVHQIEPAIEGKEGFFVLKGTRARLKDGSVVEIIDWLSDEGILEGMHINGYSVLHTAPEPAYMEKLIFLRAIYDAPFLPLRTRYGPDDFDDDIPF